VRSFFFLYFSFYNNLHIYIYILGFQVNSVRLPHHVGDKKLFCGTALVEFSSEEEVEKVMKEKMVYAGAELELKPK